MQTTKKIKIYTAYYENDSKVFDYFKTCSEHLYSILGEINEYEIEVINIEDKKCNFLHIETLFENESIKKFLFVGYSHGEKDSLVYDNLPFIQSQYNDKYFHESFFYTNACLCGQELGQSIANNKNALFIGNTDVSFVLVGYNDLLMECENAALKYFLLGYTLKDSFIEMIKLYNQTIDKLDVENVFYASLLTRNRDALVMLGNPESLISEFYI